MLDTEARVPAEVGAIKEKMWSFISLINQNI